MKTTTNWVLYWTLPQESYSLSGLRRNLFKVKKDGPKYVMDQSGVLLDPEQLESST